MQKELQFLEEQDISPTILAQVEAFRQEYPADEAALQRVSRPNIPFYGKDPGDGHGSSASGIEPAAVRSQGDR